VPARTLSLWRKLMQSKDEDRVRSRITDIIEDSMLEVIANLEEMEWLDTGDV